METSYFSWENGPAVIVDGVDDRLGLYLPVLEEEAGWVEATEGQVKDFFIDGSRLSKSEFAKMFGTIGDNLPDLPELT